MGEKCAFFLVKWKNELKRKDKDKIFTKHPDYYTFSGKSNLG